MAPKYYFFVPLMMLLEDGKVIFGWFNIPSDPTLGTHLRNQESIGSLRIMGLGCLRACSLARASLYNAVFLNHGGSLQSITTVIHEIAPKLVKKSNNSSYPF